MELLRAEEDPHLIGGIRFPLAHGHYGLLYETNRLDDGGTFRSFLCSKGLFQSLTHGFITRDGQTVSDHDITCINPHTEAVEHCSLGVGHEDREQEVSVMMHLRNQTSLMWSKWKTVNAH